MTRTIRIPALVAAIRRMPRRGWLAMAVTLALVVVLVPVGIAQAGSINLAPNPSVEAGAGSHPVAWSSSGSGSNARTFSYPKNGAAAGKRFVRVAVTAFRTGSAGWMFAPVRVTARTAYTFSDWSRSNTTSVVQARLTSTSGRISYLSLGTVPAGVPWRQATFTFLVPAGTARLTVQHLLVSNGTLDLDNTRLVAGVVVASPGPPSTLPPTPRPPVPTPTPSPTVPPLPAGAPLVSITLDDGLRSQYDNAFPVLKHNALPATFYLISSVVNGAVSYLTTAQGRELLAAGEEIGAHTVTHRDLTSLSPEEVTAELANSKASLEAQFGPISSMAYPFGATNDQVTAQVARYYTSARTTAGGVNVRGSYDPFRLRMRYITAGTDAATVAGWMREAAQSGAWTILVYHSVAYDGASTTVTPEEFAAQMAAVKACGIRTVTVSTGISLTS